MSSRVLVISLLLGLAYAAVSVEKEGKTAHLRAGDLPAAASGEQSSASDTWVKVLRGKAVTLAHWASARADKVLHRQEPAGQGGVDVTDNQNLFVANFRELLMSALIYAVLATLLAYYYKSHKAPVEPNKTVDDKSFQDWTTGILNPSDWAKDPAVCAMACCCPAIRWADSMQMVGIFSFWVAFAIFLAIETLNAITSGALFWIVLAVVVAINRQKIRTAFGMESNGFIDYLCACCCLPCVLSQEARHIDEAAQCGHKAIVKEESP